MDNIKLKVEEKENDYLKIRDNLTSNLENISKDYDNKVQNIDKTTNPNSKDLQAYIIKTSQETLRQVSAGLTPSIVLNLLGLEKF